VESSALFNKAKAPAIKRGFWEQQGRINGPMHISVMSAIMFYLLPFIQRLPVQAFFICLLL